MSLLLPSPHGRSRRNEEEIMNAKETRMLFTAGAISALAALLASSAQARMTDGNGTQPPSKAVASEQQAFADVLASFPQTRIQDGNGTQPPSKAVVKQRLSPQGSRTFFVDSDMICA